MFTLARDCAGVTPNTRVTFEYKSEPCHWSSRREWGFDGNCNGVKYVRWNSRCEYMLRLSRLGGLKPGGVSADDIADIPKSFLSKKACRNR